MASSSSRSRAVRDRIGGGPPREVEGSDQDVVAGRHARRRAHMVPGEAQGCRGGRRSGSLGSPGHGASFDVAGRWWRGATPRIPPGIATGGDGMVDRSARPQDGDGPHPGVRRAGGQQAPSRSCPGPAGGPTPPPAWRRADCGATPRYWCPRASRTRPAHRNGCGRRRCRPTCREPGARVGGGGS